MKRRIGIAVDTVALTAVVRDRSRDGVGQRHAFRVAVADGDWPAAFQQVRAALTAAGVACEDAVVDLALLPPLSDTRLIRLPQLRAAEAEVVVRRDAARHFVGIQPPVAAAVRVQPAAQGTGVDAVAAIASESLVDTLLAGVAATGWRVRSVVPAHAAWLAAAGNADAVAAVHGGVAHVMRLEQGMLRSIRRAPAEDPSAVAALLERATTAVLFGDDAARTAIGRPPHAVGSMPAAQDAAHEAAAAAGDAGMSMGTASLVRARSARERALAARLAAAAVVLLVAAAAVQLWGAHRELDALRHRRAAIQPQVEPLLALRDSADRLAATAAEVDSAGSAAARVSGALFDIALLLPEGTYLTRLHASGDTLTLDGAGPRAGPALQALRGAGSLRDVRLVGAVQRELEDGSTAVERFRITARIAGMPTAAELIGVDDGMPRGVQPEQDAPASPDPAARRPEVW